MQKLTRQKSLIPRFAPYATNEPVLVIGDTGAYKNPYFPNMTIMDINPDVQPNIVADAHNIPFPDNSFQVVIATALLNHVLDPQRVVDEIWRVLKPGGYMIIGASFVFSHHSAPHDYWRFTRRGVERLCRDFILLNIEPQFGEFTTIGILLERIMLQSQLRGGRFTKAVLFILSRMFTLFDGLIVKSWGNIEKTARTPEIMTSGYFVVAKK